VLTDVRFSNRPVQRKLLASFKSSHNSISSRTRDAPVFAHQWSLQGLPRPTFVGPRIYSPITYMHCAGRPEAIAGSIPRRGSRLSSLWTGAVGTVAAARSNDGYGSRIHVQSASRRVSPLDDRFKRMHWSVIGLPPPYPADRMSELLELRDVQRRLRRARSQSAP